ncbi:hypothetical protein HG531_004544 [Fusarium graminearum]|nr:hypothetical protein HG531_004544 [Fusarium graminearum]
MTKNLPLTQLTPIGIRSIRVIRITILEPRFLVPIASANFLVGMRHVNAHYSKSSDYYNKDTQKFEHHKEAVETRTSLCADGVCNAHDNENKDGEKLVLYTVILVDDAGG